MIELRWALLLLALLPINRIASGQATIHVPGDYPTIQAAIDNASVGDQILVAAGTYNERLVIKKGLYLSGEPNQPVPVIQLVPPYRGWEVAFEIQSDGPGKISGFEIVGLQSNGAGIWIRGDGWEISDNIIRAHWFGVETYHNTATIRDNLFLNNTGTAIGAGKNTLIQRNTLIDNSGGIIVHNEPIIENNIIISTSLAIISQNDQSGIGNEAGNATIRNNTVTIGGTWPIGKDQVGIVLSGGYYGDDSLVENNIVAYGGRTGVEFSATTPDGVSRSNYALHNNDVFGNNPDYAGLSDPTGQNGNVSIAPLFCSNSQLVYLRSDSPLIDAGSPSILDPDGSRSDMGAIGGPNASAIRYAPAGFELLEPADGKTIGQHFQFGWGATYDRDPGDEISYRLILSKNIPWYENKRLMIDTLYTTGTTIDVDLDLPDNTYFWTVDAIDKSGLFTRATSEFKFVLARSTDSELPEIADETLLTGNAPNPFSFKTTLSYRVGVPSHIRLSVFDALGREVDVLVNKDQAPGDYQVDWVPEMRSGGKVGSGMYYVCLNTGSKNQTRTILYVK